MRSVFGYLGNTSLSIQASFAGQSESFFGFMNSNNKFEKDKVFYETDTHIFVLDGVILNKIEVKTKNDSWEEFLLNSWLLNPSELLNTLRGEFSGFVYEKSTKSLALFNNPTGTRNLFFYHNNDKFAFASSAIDLIYLVKNLNWPIEISPDGSYSFLAYGSLINGSAWLVHSQKLLPGNILNYKSSSFSLLNYKHFEVEPKSNYSKSQLLDEFDNLMKQAVKLEWEKDKEYNYKHFATLSGGLDSRVNVMLARELGFVEQDNFCCSKKGYADELISKEMAKDFKHNYFFHGLDGLEHFKEAEYLLDKLGGSTVYMGPAHLRYGIDKYWSNDYGIIHSGQWGDAVLGGFISSKSLDPLDIQFGRESFETLPSRNEFDLELKENYLNQEMFKIHERAFHITNTGFWILEDLSYYSSPFCNVDVLDFVMKLPYSLKYKRQFYLEWIIKYHPQMTEYKWEYIHSKPNALWKLKYATEFMRLKFGVRKLLSPKFRASFDMTPEQYWYENSKEIQLYYKEKLSFYFNRIKDKEFPYKKEIIQFSSSKDFGQLSKALSILIIFNKILIDD